MDEVIVHNPPISITDLVSLKQRGAAITVGNTFEINEVDLVHEKNPFRAFLFFSVFSGTVDGESYEFRKCYSRGCTNNLCPHVSQAVMIANRYLKRDYKTLEKTGIRLEENLFTLEDMLAQFEKKRDDFVNTLILEDYIHIAKDGDEIVIQVSVERFAAVENFANYSEKRLFFAANFNVDYLGETHICHRCFSCCMADREREDAQTATELANRRLASIYKSFDHAGIEYNREFFQ
jgi:hypothetical protein